MSKKKSKNAGPKKAQPAPKKRSSRNVWIIAAVAVVAVVAIATLASGGSKGASSAPSGPEAQYVGRLLPDGYQAPKVASQTLYTKAVAMTQIAATQDADGFSVPLDSVVGDKIVRFDYQRSDGKVLPMIAYVKPSGGLFVGVSYCPPCEGEGQRIEADGTLTCESCGTKRNLETNVGISGACKLYPLDEIPSTVSADRIVVDSSVLDSWTAQPLDRPVG